MHVLVVEPGLRPYEKEIGDRLPDLQKEIGGMIEVVYPFQDPVALICNEEGKLLGLPLNRALQDENGRTYDVIAGTFLLAGLGDEDFLSLDPNLTEKYKEYFKYPERFLLSGQNILPVRVPEGCVTEDWLPDGEKRKNEIRSRIEHSRSHRER